MEFNWIEQPRIPKWHPTGYEYHSTGGHGELLDFFMDQNWVVNAFPHPIMHKIYRGVIVSIAGSGNEAWEDRLFNVSLLAFDCDRFDYLYRFVSFLDEWENPKRDIPEEQLNFMRLTERDYIFRKFSDQQIEQVVSTADFVIMFNAREKREILEARFPIFKTKPFICFKNDIHWNIIRGVPEGIPILEYFSSLQGKEVVIRRPAKEVLLTGWLLTLKNPVFKEQGLYWHRFPSLLREVTDFALVEYARIFVDGATVSAIEVLIRDGFNFDSITNVWYFDVPIYLRYQMIQRVRALLYNRENHPVAWIPVRGPERVRYNSPVTIPSEEERRKLISKLPNSILLQTSEDFLGAVPHSSQVRHIYAQAGAFPLPRDRGLEDLPF